MSTDFAINPDCPICKSRGSICWSCEREAERALQSKEYRERHIIRNLADFHDAMSMATFGYERYFLPCDDSGDIDGSTMCASCVEKELETRLTHDASFTLDDFGYIMQVADSDTGLHGGITCDQCYTYAVEPTCAECGDATSDDETDSVILFHISGEMALHLSCAAKLVNKGIANRLPGRGISVSYARQRETVAAPGDYTYKG